MRYGEIACKKVKWVLRNYREIVTSVADFRADKSARKGTRELHSTGYVSDPTYKAAENNSTEIKIIYTENGGFLSRPERWIETVKSVYENLSPEDQKLVELSFFEDQINEVVADEMCMNIMTFYKRRERLVLLFMVKAAENGLIRLE